MNWGLGVALWRFLRRPPLSFKMTAIILATICYGAAGYLFFERPGKPELEWLDGFWWSVVTMTAVGYGDFFPVTTLGRFVVAYPVMLIGIGFMTYGLAQLAGFFVRADLLNRKGLIMAKQTDHIVICNYPSKGQVADLLRELRLQPATKHLPVVLIDETLVELDRDIADQGVTFVRGHPALSATLERANVSDAERAIVLARDSAEPASDDTTVAICLALKTLYPQLRVVAECVVASNQEVLERSGCDSIVCVMSLGPGIFAQELHEPGVVDVLQELTIWDNDINNIFIVPLRLPAGEKTVADLHAYAVERELIVLGLRRAGDGARHRVCLNPAHATVLAEGDAAVLITQNRPTTIAL